MKCTIIMYNYINSAIKLSKGERQATNRTDGPRAPTHTRTYPPPFPPHSIAANVCAFVWRARCKKALERILYTLNKQTLYFT